MSEYLNKLENKQFQNWIKGAFALNITKDGVKELVTREISLAHKKILGKVLNKTQIETQDFCKTCCLENVLYCRTSGICNKQPEDCKFHSSKQYVPCPKNICNQILNKIRKTHVFNTPAWRNTSPERWCTNPWEMAKCYMPPPGYQEAESADQTDFNGILSVFLNHKDLSSYVSREITQTVRQLTNNIRHSSSLLVEDTQLAELIDALLDFLTCTDYLRSDVRASAAVADIKKLKTNNLNITMDEVAKVVRQTSENHSEKAIHLLKDVTDNYQAHSILSFEDLKELFSSVKGTPAKMEQYKELETDLRYDLITFYREEHNSILVSPFLYETDVDILDFYVTPKMIKKDWGQIRETQPNPFESYEDVFGKDTEIFRNIYISAHAGTGKTTFVKRLCTTWCYAKDKERTTAQCISPSDLKAMERFDFLFMVMLRDASDCDVDKMIRYQVIANLSRARKYDEDFIEHVLHHCRCLIVLDGLDEWLHPCPLSNQCKNVTPVPHKKAREKCTVISTTRPWKMAEMKITRSKVDNYIEMTTLSEQSTNRLVANVIGFFEEGDENTNQTLPFMEVMKLAHLQDLLNVPIILIQLVYLWHQKRCLGQSKCQIYSNIIEFMLERGHERDASVRNLPQCRSNETSIPSCLSGNDYSRRYFDILLGVGKLAYLTLFVEKKETSIVFDEDILNATLGQGDEKIKCCLSIGLVTKSKVRNTTSVRKYKYSFMHKTVQEYFCALYMQSCEFQLDDFRKVCNSVQNVLDLPKVLVFLNGLCPQTARKVSAYLTELVKEDPVGLDFKGRVTTHIDWNSRFKVLKNFQTIYVESLKENSINGSIGAFALPDIIIDDDCKVESYRTALKEIIETNREQIRTVKIYDIEGHTQIQEYISFFNLRDVEKLEKIEIIGYLETNDMECLLEKSLVTLKCVTMCKDRLRDKYWMNKDVQLSSEFVTKAITKMPQLIAMMLESARLSHADMQIMFEFFGKKTDMQQINLGFLVCSDCVQCEGFDLDLSAHTKLNMLQLGDIPIASVKIFAGELDQCRVGTFRNGSVLPSVLTCVEQAPKLRSLLLFDAKDDDTDKMLRVLPCLKTVQMLVLKKVHINDKQIKLPLGIQHIKLSEVHISVDAFKFFLEDVKKAEGLVRVEMFDCVIDPKESYEDLKSHIKSDKEFVVAYEENTEKYGDQFNFTNVKKTM